MSIAKYSARGKSALLSGNPQLIIPDVLGMSAKEAAHAYLRSGFIPHPWRGQKKSAYSGFCFDTFTETHDGIRHWRAGWKCGLTVSRSSGLIALDIDDRALFRAWAAEAGLTIPPTAWASTGRDGGAHLLYDARELLASGSWPAQGDLPVRAEAWGQLKSAGFIAVEPSRHPSGRPYRWHAREVAPLGDLGPALMALRGEAGHAERAMTRDVAAWLVKYGAGKPCDFMRRMAAGVDDLPGTAHDAASARVTAIVKGIAEGHTGGNVALRALRDAFYARCAERAYNPKSTHPRHGPGVVAEWRGLLDSAVAKYGEQVAASDILCDELKGL